MQDVGAAEDRLAVPVPGPAERQQEQEHARRLSRLYPNSFQTADVKHVVDNLLHECLDGMVTCPGFVKKCDSCLKVEMGFVSCGNMSRRLVFRWPRTLEGLRALEKLLRPPTMRERFAACCLGSGHESAPLLENWSHTLVSLRWEAIEVFCRNLLVLEPVLRQAWSLQAFLKGSGTKHKPWQQRSPNETSHFGFGPALQMIDSSIRSEAFWTGVSICHDVAWEAELIGRWAEGCYCCTDRQSQLAITDGGTGGTGRRRRPARPKAQEFCPYRGCRAADLASGAWEDRLKKAMLAGRNRVTQFLVTASGSDRGQFFQDWTQARGRLWAGLQIKLAHWKQLPWRLCNLMS